MKKAKTAVAILLCFVMLFSACSKNKGSKGEDSSGDSSSAESETSLQLLYCSSDTLNPFNTENQLNVMIGRLIYEPLFSLSNEFEAIPVLAESISVNEKTYTVKLISAKFSDGSAVTAEDVLSSFLLAKESPLYSYLFYNVISAEAVNETNISFTLKNLDPYFQNMLTFPVIKKDSDKLTDSDKVELPPIGSGKFAFASSEALSEKMLIKNTQYHGECNVDIIKLVDAPDSEAVAHHVEVGATDIYYTDPASSNIVRMSGKKSSVNLNNLVYIGVNHSKGKLSDPAIRQALSAALDRTELAKTPYYGNAIAAPGFFHPDFKPCIGYQTIQLTADNKICIENLEKIGYNRLDSDGFYLNEKGDRLEFDLLVNDENSARVAAAKLISKQAAEVGIKINVNAVDSELYLAAIKANNFELYIGEVKVSQNMDMSELVLPGGRAAFGILAPKKTTDESGAASRDYTDVIEGIKKGEDLVSSLATSLVTDMPVIPLLFRSSLLFYSKNVSDVSGASAYDPLLSINNFI